MNCPKCHGSGLMLVPTVAPVAWWHFADEVPCDDPGCHKGQIERDVLTFRKQKEREASHELP